VDFVIYRRIWVKDGESTGKLLKPKYSIVLCIKQIENLETKSHMSAFLLNLILNGFKNTYNVKKETLPDLQTNSLFYLS